MNHRFTYMDKELEKKETIAHEAAKLGTPAEVHPHLQEHLYNFFLPMHQ